MSRMAVSQGSRNIDLKGLSPTHGWRMAKQAVALASPALQPGTRQQADPAAIAPNQAILFQRRQQAVDPGTAAPEHSGQTLLGQRKVVIADSVLHHEQPPAAPGFEAVQ